MKYFLDTNCLIHYQLFSEIDWKSEFHDENVVLVICPAVIKELDHKKFSEQDINIRKRCQLVIKKLSECIMGKTPKTNTDIVFISKEPTIDWISENLSTDIPDDRIIASVIDYGNIAESIIVTADLGLRLKANLKGIHNRELSTDLFQQLSDDTKEKEIRRLNEKLVRLESKHPVLKLVFNTSNESSEFINFHIRNELLPSKQNIEELILIESKELLYEKPQSIALPIMTTLESFIIPDENEINRYERECIEYLQKLEIYYQEENERQNRLLRTYELKLSLENIGSVPAEDIDVFMHFPDGFELSEDNIDFEELKRPERPLKPQTLADKIRNTSLYPGYTLRSMPFNTHHIEQQKPNCFISGFKKTNSYEVEFHIYKLKHNQSISLNPLFIFFNTIAEIKSFEIEYNLYIGNHPEKNSGKLNIIFA